MPGRPAHLVRRFFGSLGVGRPSPVDQQFVAGLLQGEEARLFWAQPVMDQAHGVTAARAVAVRRPRRSDLARAALLHDVGKRHAALGVIGRSIASGFSLLGIPVRGRYRRYLDHGKLGADDLEQAGCDSLTIEFARHHHGVRPTWFAPDDWAVLVEADHG